MPEPQRHWNNRILRFVVGKGRVTRTERIVQKLSCELQLLEGTLKEDAKKRSDSHQGTAKVAGFE